ncbi:hypothetical protein ACVWVZ_002991 [Pseudomonas tolaasii]
MFGGEQRSQFRLVGFYARDELDQQRATLGKGRRRPGWEGVAGGSHGIVQRRFVSVRNGCNHFTRRRVHHVQ